MSAFSLNFGDDIEIPEEEIAAAIEEQQQEERKLRARDYALDRKNCQDVVDRGKAELARLRKAEEEFLKEFKKLKDIPAGPQFVEALNSLSPDARRVLGCVDLRGSYKK